MKFLPRTPRILILAATAWGLVLLLNGCISQPTPAPVLPTAPPTLVATLAPSSTLTLPPTARPTATLTAAPTLTATPTQTSTPIPETLTAWCMPAGMAVPVAVPASMPPNGRTGVVDPKGAMRLKVPASSCTFIYTFSQPIQNDLELQVFDRATQPFLKIRLIPVTGSPNKAAVTLTHSYLLDPPFWEISYRFQLNNGNGTLRRADQVVIYKATPPLCWNEQLPNPVTLACPDLDGDWNIDKPETWRGKQ